MGFIQESAQKMLSKLLGAEVSFENLNVSLLGGSIEAQGMSVVVGGGEAFLKIRRLKAEVSIPKALKREIDVKSLSIEGVLVSIVVQQNGTTNLPKAGKSNRSEPENTGGDKSEEGPKSWKLEAQKVLLVDGELRIRRETADGVRHFGAEKIVGEITAAGGGMDFTCIIESAGRREPAVEIGQIRFTGRADGVTDLSQWAAGSVTAQIDIADRFRANLSLPQLSPPAGKVDGSGAVDLTAILPWLTDSLARSLAGLAGGRAELSIKAGFRPGSLNIEELHVGASNMNLKKPA